MKPSLWILLSLISAAQPLQAKDASWPMFRGNPARTGSSGSGLPAQPALLWAHETGGPVSSSAALVDGVAYVGNEEGLFVALDLKSGMRAWEHQFKSAIESSPCVAEGLVLFGDDDGVLHALSRSSGQEAWSFETGDKIIALPSLVDGTIWVGSYDYSVYALDASGQKKWQFQTDAQVHCSPCLAGTDIVTGGCDGFLRMIDSKTGTERAKLHIQDIVAATPAFSGGRVFALTYSAKLLAVDPKGPSTIWETPASSGDITASPAVAGDAIVFVGPSDVIQCVESSTGKKRWEYPVGATVESSPVVAKGVAYFGAENGLIQGVRVQDGKKVWGFEAGSAIQASPSVGEGCLVVGAQDGAVYGFGRKR